MASRLDHWITVHSFRKSTLNTSFTQINVLLKFSSWPLLVVIQNISTGTWPLYKVTCLKSTSRASHNPQGCAWYINIYWQRNLVLLLSIDWSINCLLDLLPNSTLCLCGDKSVTAVIWHYQSLLAFKGIIPTVQ